MNRRNCKKKGKKAISLGGVVLLGVIAFCVYYWCLPFSCTNTDVAKSVKQENSDTPIYFLLLGIDSNTPANADSIQLVGINWEKENAFIISLPPSLMINNKGKIGVYPLSDTYQSGGIEEVKSHVENIFHIFIPYYIVINELNASNWINTRGKVGMYVEEDMYHEKDAASDINLARGYADLDGNKVVEYLRYQKESQSLLERVQRQQRFMKVYLKEFHRQYALMNAVFVYQNWHLVESNITATDAGKIAYKLTNIPTDKIKFLILPGKEIRQFESRYWEPDPIGAQNVIGAMLHDVG